MCTVKQLIESLQKFPEDSPVEIALTQYNKKYPVAYLKPVKSIWQEESYATMRNGIHVRIEVNLPVNETGKTFMFTGLRKMK